MKACMDEYNFNAFEQNVKRILREKKTPIIAWHGTSSTRLRDILKKGLLSKPTELVYSKGYDKFPTMGGVYLTTDPTIAKKYANLAVKKFGGDPILVKLQFIPESTYLDEDYILDVIEGLDKDVDASSADHDELTSVIKQSLSQTFHIPHVADEIIFKLAKKLHDMSFDYLERSEVPLMATTIDLFNNDPEFVKLIDRLTKLLKVKSNVVSKFRINRDVTYRGRNKIISIQDLTGNTYY